MSLVQYCIVNENGDVIIPEGLMYSHGNCTNQVSNY